MQVATEQHEDHCLIRLEGESGVTSAVGLKDALLEGLATGTAVQVDLEGIVEIDITAMQLLWAAGREAARSGRRLEMRVPPGAVKAAQEAGFGRFPGLAAEE